MNGTVARSIAAFASGALFGGGLVVSGMTQPRKVIGFLDVLGAWDPSLLWVMVGAIGVHFVGYRWSLSRRAPLLADRFQVPLRRRIDANLIVGAAVFGAGWGLSGYCPGPSLVALPSLLGGVWVFVSALVLGILLAHAFESRTRSAAGASAGPPGGAFDSIPPRDTSRQYAASAEVRIP